MIERVLDGAGEHLRPGGRVVFTIFAFLGRKRAFVALESRGFTPSLLAAEIQGFPRIGYERLDYLRSIDVEATIPPRELPRTVERFVLQGRLA